MTARLEHGLVGPHPLPLLVQAVWPGSSFQEPHSRHPVPKDRRGERFLFVSTWIEKWKLSFSFEFLAKISGG